MLPHWAKSLEVNTCRDEKRKKGKEEREAEKEMEKIGEEEKEKERVGQYAQVGQKGKSWHKT